MDTQRSGEFSTPTSGEHSPGGHIRLTYGDVITIDAIQSTTSTEHINALPSGSDAVQSFKAYVAQSRSREATWLVVADGRERTEIMTRRALGNVEPISEADVWNNVARNLSRQPEKKLATDLLDGARGVHVGTVRSLATAFQPKQQREAEGREGTTLHRTFAQRRGEQDVARETAGMSASASAVASAAHTVANRLEGPVQDETRQAVRAARRSRQASSATNQATKSAQRRAREETAVAQKAVALWSRAKPVQTHPYLMAKQVAAHGLRRDRRNKLLVPMQDAEGRLWGVQTITLDGRALFMRGGRKRGMHTVLGELRPGAPVVIAESFTTAATVREATGLPAIVAFEGGNLMAVARGVRERDPARPIIFATDNDHHLPRQKRPLANVGLEKTTAAAAAVQGIVLTPHFKPSDKGTDWNDYAAQHGKAAVRAQIEAGLRRLGIALPPQPAARPVTQADRDAARQRITAFPKGTVSAEDRAVTDVARASERQRSPRFR